MASKTNPSAIAVSKNGQNEVICLGTEALRTVLYSPVLARVVFASPSHLSEAFLLSVCGIDWLTENFGAHVEDCKVGAYGFDASKAVMHIVTSCHNVGRYSSSQARPEGTYRSGDALIVNTGDETLVSGDTGSQRSSQPIVYTLAGQGLNFTSSTPPASREDVADLEQFLGAWTYLHETDVISLMGWIAASQYAGALQRRTHLCASGRMGTGKTVLSTVIAGFFGTGALAVDGSSSAVGITQALAGRSLPVFVDEAEMHASRAIKSIVALARSSYSSSGDGRVTGSGGGRSQAAALSSPFLFTCVQPPTFEASDASRWVMVEVTGLKPAAAATPHRLVVDEAYRKELGARLSMLAIQRWPIFRDSLEKFRAALVKKLCSARLAETWAPLYAGYWMLKHDKVATAADVERLLKKLDASVTVPKERQSDELDCLHAMLTKIVTSRALRGEGRISVGELVTRATASDLTADRELQRMGVRVTRKSTGEWVMCIPVSASHMGLRTLLTGTRFAHGSWSSILKRITGAEETTQRLLDVSTKVVQFPVPTELLSPDAADPAKGGGVKLKMAA